MSGQPLNLANFYKSLNDYTDVLTRQLPCLAGVHCGRGRAVRWNRHRARSLGVIDLKIVVFVFVRSAACITISRFRGRIFDGSLSGR
jgi:hypothetical protein